MKMWSDWTENKNISATHPPDVEPGDTVRIEYPNRTIDIGQAKDFNWSRIPRYQTEVEASEAPE